MSDEASWRTRWTSIDQDPLARALMTLSALNGLKLETAAHLSPHAIQAPWIYTPQGTIPLTRQAQSALERLAGQWWTPEQALDIFTRLDLDDESLQRRLAGALWYTSDEGHLIGNFIGIERAPLLPLENMFPFSVIARLPAPAQLDVEQSARLALQRAADWLERETLAPPLTLSQKLVRLLSEGRLVFLLVSTGVSGLNLLHNLMMGRLLAPALYGQLTLIITLQLLIGLLPNALQTVTSRFSAGYVARSSESALRGLWRWSRQSMFGLGIAIGGILLVLAPWLAQVFQLSSASVLIPIALASAPFIWMGADRGILQGLNAYFWLSGAYLIEALARLGLGVLLVLALAGTGGQLEGAIWALAQGMCLTWFISYLALRVNNAAKPSSPDTHERGEWQRLTRLILLALVGQAIITNSDFLLVKSLFTPQEAGLYAAVSVLGRIAYFGVLPLTTVMIPAIARQQALGESTRRSFLILVGGGMALCMSLLIVATLFAPQILGVLYGTAYQDASSFLPLYTLAASLYVITNLIVLYRLALGAGSESALPFIAGIAQIVGILLFHQSLSAVISVQVIVMSVLLLGVAWRTLRPQSL